MPTHRKQVVTFVVGMRRTLSFCIVQFFLGFVFGRDLDLLMLLYWVVLAAFVGYIMFPLLMRQLASVQIPLEQPPPVQPMTQ